GGAAHGYGRSRGASRWRVGCARRRRPWCRGRRYRLCLSPLPASQRTLSAHSRASGNPQSPARNLWSGSPLSRGRTDVVARGRRYTAGAAAFKLNVTARRSAKALSFSRAPNPVWSPPPAGTLRGGRGTPAGRGRAHPMQIGVAGIGKRGAAIAHRLIEVGHKVTAWNRSADKLQPVIAAGAAAAATPAELARNAEAVITILTDA